MKALIKNISLLLLVAVASSGCCSYAVLKNSEKKIATRRAIARGDEAAIKAISLGSDSVGIGIDVTNLEALTEQPLLQVGAALLDAGILYGVSEGLQALDIGNDDDSDGRNINVTGDDNTVTVRGDNNGDGNGDDNSSETNN